MRNILLATAALTLIAAPAMAQSISSPQVSGSVGYTVLDGDDANLGAITGRVTAKVNPYFGVEGEASFGVKDDDITVGAVTGDLSHEYDVAAYGVATLGQWDGRGAFAASLAILGGAVVAGGVAFVVVAKLLGSAEVGEVLAAVRRRAGSPRKSS